MKEMAENEILRVSEARNAMKREVNAMDSVMIPLALAKRWIKNEEEYQVTLANKSAVKLLRIIKQQQRTIEALEQELNTQ